MDPVTMVAAAIAAGAAAGVSDTAKQGVSDAYRAVKALIAGRYRSVDVEAVEQQPQSPQRRAALADELRQASAGDDEELLVAARQLLVVVHQQLPDAVEAVGVHLREVSAGELEVSDVTSAGSGVIAENTTVSGALRISGITAGGDRQPHPPAARP
ncbi:hypothetical protein NOVA_29095 [Nocardia nova]|uniref:hypothetical protein n=1 Tax=Nocardia nova TaxID=37330 RepID=UPI001C463F27|nr:hypothetical protein [Nocardia nova]MBV7706849.1 hypothetical protein [Nocardia nova]